jgi:hypothetical protein
MPGILSLRKPPGMLGTDYSGIYTGEKLGTLADSSPGRFDNYPVAFFDAFPGSGFRVNLHKGFPVKLS